MRWQNKEEMRWRCTDWAQEEGSSVVIVPAKSYPSLYAQSTFMRQCGPVVAVCATPLSKVLGDVLLGKVMVHFHPEGRTSSSGYTSVVPEELYVCMCVIVIVISVLYT